ncbi:MAG: penicillin-binding protein 2 [Elusimicrobia bacterium]|nr:penicillin-binding protein 2 [Elusimicrobiota bacterium]
MTSKSRLTCCTLLCLVPLLPITARLGELQILQHRELSSRAVGQMNLESIQIASRGRILDRSGKVLAESLPSWSSFLDPSLVKSRTKTADLLADVMQVGRAEILRKLRAPNRFVWLKRKITPEERDSLIRLKIDGVAVLEDAQRFYPNDRIARGLLGAVSVDQKGLSGLESAYESDLAGTPGTLRLIRDGSGRHVLLAAREQRQAPPDLILTIDQNMQHFAHAALQEGVARHEPRQALVMVQDSRSGDLLAVASHPEDPLKNPAVQETFEPGSTYKLVTMAAALEENWVGIGDESSGEGGRWEVSPRVTIKDHEPLGTITIAEAFEKSSNIVLAKLGLALGPDRFYFYSHAFGFGVRTGIDLPGESPGHVRNLGLKERVELANNSFGQGLSVTALQMLNAYTAVANDGVLLEPRLVMEAGRRKTSASAVVRRVAGRETIQTLKRLLEGVVERGTGIAAAVPGYRIAGKTGTAQKLDETTRRYSATDYVASFVGYAPSRSPRFTILVLMDSPRKGYYGSDVAAPLFSKLMRQLLAYDGIAPDAAPDPPVHVPVFSRRPLVPGPAHAPSALRAP